DYGRFADMLANGGERDGVRVLSAAAVATLTSPYGEQAPLLSSLTAFGRYEAGSIGQGLGGVVRLDDRSGPGSAGEYAWGGAAGTGFWATPKLGLSVTLMTQLMPVTALPARDLLRPAIYRALAAG
ncbi:MAG: serine hydrolase, partial [Xanthomonadales bacterium]|nr:serine hydrolase [Xanthomonadales bacterium]